MRLILSDDIVKRVEDNLKDTPNQRIGDINIIYLARVVQSLENQINNGIVNKIDRIWEKINVLPCNVHSELIKKINEITQLKIDSLKNDINNMPKLNRTLINWLFALYATNLFGIVFLAFKIFAK